MIKLIAALAKNDCIGKDGQLPWKIPEDMKHFKDLTMGHVVVMGRKTWESIPEKFRPLPGRTNVVISRRKGYPVPTGVELYEDPKSALAAHQNEDVYVIGGAEIYLTTIDRADELLITEVDQTVDGDAFFPRIDPKNWREIEREPHDGFTFVTYYRH